MAKSRIAPEVRAARSSSSLCLYHLPNLVGGSRALIALSGFSLLLLRNAPMVARGSWLVERVVPITFKGDGWTSLAVAQEGSALKSIICLPRAGARGRLRVGRWPACGRRPGRRGSAPSWGRIAAQPKAAHLSFSRLSGTEGSFCSTPRANHRHSRVIRVRFRRQIDTRLASSL
jgi:hypothetical protein